MSANSELHIQLQDYLVYTEQRVDDGEMTYLDAVIAMREEKEFYESQLDIIKGWEENSKDEIEQEAAQYQNEYKGVKFEFRSGGKTFNFKGIKEIDEAKNNLKELESKYQAAWENKQKGLMSVTEDGEELQLPEVSYRKSSMIVKLPKSK
ncbi:MAG TPA: hypothetical protein VKY44_03940 [Flavobacterium sp.]|nr:hypothetical protein [Flavobacterium sp.]